MLFSTERFTLLHTSRRRAMSVAAPRETMRQLPPAPECYVIIDEFPMSTPPMKLTKETYQVSRATIEKLLAVLPQYHVSSNSEDEFNNEDVIEADKLLQEEVRSQDRRIPNEPPPMKPKPSKEIRTAYALRDEAGLLASLRERASGRQRIRVYRPKSKDTAEINLTAAEIRRLDALVKATGLSRSQLIFDPPKMLGEFVRVR